MTITGKVCLKHHFLPDNLASQFCHVTLSLLDMTRCKPNLPSSVGSTASWGQFSTVAMVSGSMEGVQHVAVLPSVYNLLAFAVELKKKGAYNRMATSSGLYI